MKTQTITLSKTSSIIKCCAIVFLIAVIITSVGKINMHEFAVNILDWQSI